VNRYLHPRYCRTPAIIIAPKPLMLLGFYNASEIPRAHLRASA
jgi:hypothetical protein